MTAPHAETHITNARDVGQTLLCYLPKYLHLCCFVSLLVVVIYRNSIIRIDFGGWYMVWKFFFLSRNVLSISSAAIALKLAAYKGRLIVLHRVTCHSHRCFHDLLVPGVVRLVARTR